MNLNPLSSFASTLSSSAALLTSVEKGVSAFQMPLVSSLSEKATPTTSDPLKDASMGASLGSVLPGIGALMGGILGGLFGLFQKLFSKNDPSDVANQ